MMRKGVGQWMMPPDRNRAEKGDGLLDKEDNHTQGEVKEHHL